MIWLDSFQLNISRKASPPAKDPFWSKGWKWDEHENLMESPLSESHGITFHIHHVRCLGGSDFFEDMIWYDCNAHVQLLVRLSIKIHQGYCHKFPSSSSFHDHPPSTITKSHCSPMLYPHLLPSLCKKVSCIPSVSGPVLPHVDPIHHLGFDHSAWTSNGGKLVWEKTGLAAVHNQQRNTANLQRDMYI